MAIVVQLRCDAEDCKNVLELEWPRDQYASLLDPNLFIDKVGHVTLDGAMHLAEAGWQLGDQPHAHVVRCSEHAEEVPPR